MSEVSSYGAWCTVINKEHTTDLAMTPVHDRSESREGAGEHRTFRFEYRIPGQIPSHKPATCALLF